MPKKAPPRIVKPYRRTIPYVYFKRSWKPSRRKPVSPIYCHDGPFVGHALALSQCSDLSTLTIRVVKNGVEHVGRYVGGHWNPAV